MAKEIYVFTESISLGHSSEEKSRYSTREFHCIDFFDKDVDQLLFSENITIEDISL